MARTTSERPLAGKVALITGGSRGIGAAIARRLAADGASVAFTYSKGADAASSVVKDIERGGGKAIAIQADAADAEAVRNAVEKTVTTLGRLDVLVNNAGTVIPVTVEETTLADFDRVFAVNVRGVFVATQAALKHLKPGGRIIMIGSCVGERVFIPGMAPYAATKGAVKMFTQGLARELGARGITVNNVQPGPIDTELNPVSGEWAVSQKAVVPLDRYGDVDEVAALVAFVAGPESSYINGANLTVEVGGIHMVTQTEDYYSDHDGGKFAPIEATTVATWKARALLENLTVDAEGAVFVTVYSHNCVDRYDPATGATTTFAEVPAPPMGLAFDADGVLWVGGGTLYEAPGFIWRVERTGAVRQWCELPDATFMNGCTMHPNGRTLLACESSSP